MSPAVSSPRRPSSPWAFFAAVLAWSWLFWGLAITVGDGVTTGLGTAFAFLGLLGPMIGGIAFTHLTRDRKGRREYWSRLLDPRRIPAGWLAVALLLPPALMLLAALLDVLTGGSVTPYRDTLAPFVARPLTLLPFALNVFFIGPFPEEFGWRGYALDRLQERWGALRSSLVLGTIWGAWHLPLFFMQGTYQYEQGAWSLWFWTFMVGIVPLTVVFTWVFNNTRRSTLAVVLLHFTVVVSADFLNATAGTNVLSTVLWIALAAGLCLVWGPTTLRRRRWRRASRPAASPRAA